MGHHVTVLTTRVKDSLPRVERTHGFRVVRVSLGVTIAGNDVSPAGRGTCGTRGRTSTLIPAHSHLYFATNLAALARRLGDVPLAITSHRLYSYNTQAAGVALIAGTIPGVGKGPSLSSCSSAAQLMSRR